MNNRLRNKNAKQSFNKNKIKNPTKTRKTIVKILLKSPTVRKFSVSIAEH